MWIVWKKKKHASFLGGENSGNLKGHEKRNLSLRRSSSRLRDRGRKSPGTYEWGVLVLGAFSWMWTWTKTRVVKKRSPSAMTDAATSWWFSQQPLYRPPTAPPPAGKITEVPMAARWPLCWRPCELERFVLGSVRSLLGCVPNAPGGRGQSYVDKTRILWLWIKQRFRTVGLHVWRRLRRPSPLCITHIYDMSTRETDDEMCGK